MTLIFCIPFDVASYLFKDYENFFDSSNLRTDTIFILNIPKENNSEKMVELWFLFSAFCAMKLSICSKFHIKIDDRFKVLEWIGF